MLRFAASRLSSLSSHSLAWRSASFAVSKYPFTFDDSSTIDRRSAYYSDFFMFRSQFVSHPRGNDRVAHRHGQPLKRGNPKAAALTIERRVLEGA